MFTGIIEEVGNIISAKPGKIVIGAGTITQNMELGMSVSVNGVCLTVADFNTGSFSADLMAETVKRSNLGLLSTGDKVNLESPLTLGGQLGGHLVQGHIDDTGKVGSIRQEGESILIRIEAPPQVMRYIVEKGFIAIDGISLTVTDVEASSFQVSIVDFTRKHTNLEKRRQGDIINLEVDIIAKYVEKMSKVHRSGVTEDFLQEHGFVVS